MFGFGFFFFWGFFDFLISPFEKEERNEGRLGAGEKDCCMYPLWWLLSYKEVGAGGGGPVCRLFAYLSYLRSPGLHNLNQFIITNFLFFFTISKYIVFDLENMLSSNERGIIYKENLYIAYYLFFFPIELQFVFM